MRCESSRLLLLLLLFVGGGSQKKDGMAISSQHAVRQYWGRCGTAGDLVGAIMSPALGCDAVQRPEVTNPLRQSC